VTLIVTFLMSRCHDNLV